MHVDLVFSAPFVKNTIISPLKVLAPLSQIISASMGGFISELSVLQTYASVFTPVPHRFDYCSFIVNFEVRKGESYSFVLKHATGFFSLMLYSGFENIEGHKWDRFAFLPVLLSSSSLFLLPFLLLSVLGLLRYSHEFSLVATLFFSDSAIVSEFWIFYPVYKLLLICSE